jgi:hypothetical protein
MKLTTTKRVFLSPSRATAPAPAHSSSSIHSSRYRSSSSSSDPLVVVDLSQEQQHRASRTDLLIGRMSAAGLVAIGILLFAEKCGFLK